MYIIRRCLHFLLSHACRNNLTYVRCRDATVKSRGGISKQCSSAMMIVIVEGDTLIRVINLKIVTTQVGIIFSYCRFGITNEVSVSLMRIGIILLARSGVISWVITTMCSAKDDSLRFIQKKIPCLLNSRGRHDHCCLFMDDQQE
jgi:hypothetical protein